jgi:hypothetical protein
MENQNMNSERWVDKRLASLEASLENTPGWHPDAIQALARVRQRERDYRLRRRRWTWIAAAASIASFFVLASPGRCQAPGAHSCGQPLASRLLHVVPRDDPRLVTDYVNTGKVKLIHRDFPLPQHPYARLAARYANAAGRLGQYEAAVNYLFQTQNQWGVDGSVDRQLAQVLTPGIMQQVRDLVEHDKKLDDTVTSDMEMALKDAVHQTPTTVVVYRGKRQAFPGVPDYQFLKQYLDSLLAK